MEILPNRRVRLRQLCGLTLRDLADRVGVSKSRLHIWENDGTELHTSEVRAIRNTLLELAGSNHRAVRRLLSRTHTGRNELRPRTVSASPRAMFSRLGENGEIWYSENGFAYPTKVVSEILGHSDIETTLVIYQHPDTNDRREPLNEMALQMLPKVTTPMPASVN